MAVVIFNTDTDMFIFVKQFRPACYVHNAALIEGRLLSAGDKIDTEKVPGHYGLTLELCAGIIDKVSGALMNIQNCQDSILCRIYLMWK